MLEGTGDLPDPGAAVGRAGFRASCRVPLSREPPDWSGKRVRPLTASGYQGASVPASVTARLLADSPVEAPPWRRALGNPGGPSAADHDQQRAHNLRWQAGTGCGQAEHRTKDVKHDGRDGPDSAHPPRQQARAPHGHSEKDVARP